MGIPTGFPQVSLWVWDGYMSPWQPCFFGVMNDADADDGDDDDVGCGWSECEEADEAGKRVTGAQGDL